MWDKSNFIIKFLTLLFFSLERSHLLIINISFVVVGGGVFF